MGDTAYYGGTQKSYRAAFEFLILHPLTRLKRAEAIQKVSSQPRIAKILIPTATYILER